VDSKQTPLTDLMNPFSAVDYKTNSMSAPVANGQISEAAETATVQPFGEETPPSAGMPSDLCELDAKQNARMAVKSDGSIFFIDLNDVIAVEAQGNYVLLQRQSRSFRLRESISELAERLKHFGFVRIHRSALVNRSWVEEIRPCVNGEYVLRLRNGREFSVTRTYKKNLEALAELWLGNELFLGN
jgi:DNA-binding LytR/AlgR family response regulator